MKNEFKFRIRLVYFFVSLLGIIIITRLFFIQVVKGDYYANEANRQHFPLSAASFDRGSIYFSEKSGRVISAATVKDGFQVVINPMDLKDPETVYEKISTIINIDKDYFMERAGRKNDPYDVLAHRVDENAAEKIKQLNIKGLRVFKESWRYYPADSLASHILGFVGYRGDELIGRYGLEAEYENVLRRNSQKNPVNSFAEIFSDIKKIISGDPHEGDIVLTIEPTVQSVLEKEVNKIMEKYKGSLAGGIIINPKNGEILAMSAMPNFNPNFYSKVDDISVFVNPIVENIFEMGSIIKPLTLAAALNEGSIRPDTVYDDKGYMMFDSARISNYDNKARGIVNMQEVLNQSLNTGAVFAMQKLGKDKFSEYMINYGFNEKTGVELPNEVNSKISNIIKNKRELEYATASFGQGIAITPIAMIKSLISLANGGVIMQPYIVKEINIKGLKNKKNEPRIIRQVLKKETSEEISRMLANTVDKALLDGKYKMNNYTIAAKTGTAQIAKKGGGYYDNEYLHAFFGYAPAFDARFLIFLFIEKPQGVQYASHSLTTPFMNITKFLLNYYEIPPDR